MVTLLPTQEEHSGVPQWIEPTIHRKKGQDPIGMQTITQDRIMPVLLPGILALTRRARYFSFHSFLLDEYEKRKLPAKHAALDQYIKAREFEYALAVMRCSNGCGLTRSSVIGRDRARPIARRETTAFQRGLSIEHDLGGYGLYYASPMREMGLVVPEGHQLSTGSTTPVDLLPVESPARGLANDFRQAISDTRYYREYMHHVEPIPVDVIDELSERACLCRLRQFPEEREHLRHAILRYSLPITEDAVTQRRRSFALFLALLHGTPTLADSDADFRRAIWDTFMAGLEHGEVGPRMDTLAQWAALIAKDNVQEALAGIWSEFCRRGLAEQPADGFSHQELETFIRRRLVPGGALTIAGRTVQYVPDMPMEDLANDLAEAAEHVGLEELRAWSASQNTAMSGLALLLVLYHRVSDAGNAPYSWEGIASMRSAQQLGVLGLGAWLQDRVDGSDTVADTLAGLVGSYVLLAHENLAYSKLMYSRPEFTFRFRWEEGKLRFYNIGSGRFGLNDIRWEALTRITHDLGYWERDPQSGAATLTPDGHALVDEALS